MKTKIGYKFLPLVLLMLVMSCSKKEDVVTPDLASSATGTYKITSIIYGGKPANIVANSTITISRVNTNVVDLVLKGSSTITQAAITLEGSTSTITFNKKASNGTVSGNITNSTLTYNEVFTDGQTASTIIASK